MAFVYLLKDKLNDKYHIGATVNIDRRFQEHRRKEVRSTKHFEELELVGYKRYENINKARWEEHLLKKSAWRRKKFMEELEKF